jgi:hypothetical protein
MPSNTPKTRSWSVEQKGRILAEASQLTGEHLNAYLQREGVKLAELERWRIALQDGSGSLVASKRIRQLERWRGHPCSDDARHGPHSRPRNALSVIEEQQILTILTSSRYAHLPPRQLVPQLAGSRASRCFGWGRC